MPGIGGIGGLGGIAGGGALGVNGTTNLGWQGNTGNVGFIGGGFGGQAGQGGLAGGQFGNPGNRYQNAQQLNPNANRPQSRQIPGAGPDPEDDQGNKSRLTYDQLKQRREAARGDAKAKGEKIANLDPHGQLAAEAAAEELGGNVRYVIDERVSLPRQKSALLPLLDKPIEASRVCIFNETVHASFPVLGLRVKNTSGQPLTQGPVTVYEDGGYAGDARLPDLQPNEERLISYAIDLGTEVKTETRQSEGPAMTATVIGEKLHLGYTARQTRKYTIRNRSAHDRVLVIEHPVREGWELAGGAKPRESSRDYHRFDVPVLAGKDVVFEVAEEQPRVEQIAGRWHDDDGRRFLFFTSGVGVHVELNSLEASPVLLKARVAKGDVIATSRLRIPQSYRVLNGSPSEAREVTLRHRVGQGWRIAGENTTVKEFALKLAAGKDGRVDVTNEREAAMAVKAETMPVADVEKMLKHPAISEAVKGALRKVLDQRSAIEAQRAQTAEVDKRLKEIADEQDRLRKNLANLPPTSAAHKRYLEKFDKQETEIEALQEQKKKLKAAEEAKQKELADLLPTLNAE
jgi:hypothetical protein